MSLDALLVSRGKKSRREMLKYSCCNRLFILIYAPFYLIQTISFFIRDIHKWYPEMEHYVSVSLIEAGRKLLPGFEQSLSDYCLKTYKKRNVDVRMGVSVKEVKRDVMVLSDGSEVPYGLGVWSTGHNHC